MKTKFVVGVALVLAVTAIAQAGINSATCTQDNDGAITMNDVTWDPATETLRVTEIQHWGPAHIYPTFEADGDPYAWILKDVQNQTDFIWTDYHFNIYMPNPYEIVNNARPAGWIAEITQPTLEENVVLHGVNQGALYHGAVDFFVGTGSPINIGEWATFGARLFWASGDGSFCIEQIPTPEPMSLMLLAVGGLMLRRR